MRIFSNEAKALLMRLEGLRLSAYKDQAGVWTVGYGHTGSDVRPDTVWTFDQAAAELYKEIESFATGVDKLLGPTRVNQNQFDALAIFAYNIGLKAFAGSSVLTHILEGSFRAAVYSWGKWCHIHDPITGELVPDRGLVARRTAEIKLFDTPTSVSA